MKYNYSVVIPHYNSSKLLKRMLLSIPNREDIQVIVVDDMSSLPEVDALKKLQHSNLKLILQNENHGAGNARNVGLSYVLGKWTIFVDADDFFEPTAFEVFDRYVNEQIDYLCFCIKVFDDDRQTTSNTKIVSDQSVRKYLNKKNSHNELLFKFKNTVCWNKLVSTKFIRENQIHFETCKVNNDVFYTFMVSYLAKSYRVIPDELYNFVEVNTSLTHKTRDLEREFLFYLQAQKRNVFFEELGIKKYPFYRRNFLYFPFMVKKHGIIFALKFMHLISKRKEIIIKSRKSYLFLLQK